VITATSAPHPIITDRHVRVAMEGRADRPLVVVDLAVPRDVETAVASIPGVVLHTIDDIQGVVERSLAKRAAEIPQVEAVVADEVARFEAWGRARIARTRAAVLLPQAGHAV
jgi:glutamyl-tRNA reductase